MVCRSVILSTMDAHNLGKLNRLMAELGDTRLVSSRGLRAHGYSNSLVARYVGSGWLVSPARSVYMRRGGRLQWDGVVRSLQVGEGMPLYVGGASRSACRATSTTCAWLMPGRSPSMGRRGHLAGWASCHWSSALSTRARVHSNLRPCPSLRKSPRTRCRRRAWLGIPRRLGPALVCSTPERAMPELCDSVSDAAGVYEADALRQGQAPVPRTHSSPSTCMAVARVPEGCRPGPG